MIFLLEPSFSWVKTNLMKSALTLLLIAAFMASTKAADFSLLSSSVTPVVKAGSQTAQSRFSLVNPTVTSVQKLDVTSAPQPGRFTLTAKIGTVVLVNKKGLPELKLKRQPGQLEIDWEEDELLPGFILESSTALKGSPWIPVEVELTAEGRRHKPAHSTGIRFYRLRKQ
jgi:hypothetical protein